MLLHLLALVLTGVVIKAFKIENPILSDRDFRDSSALKFNGTYYVVTTSSDTSNGIFPIHISRDLIQWARVGYVFDSRNMLHGVHDFINPVIHQVGPNFLVYFAAVSSSRRSNYTGCASAPHPLGPYKSHGYPFPTRYDGDTYLPSIIQDKDKLYLLQSGGSIYGRQLTPDGLNFISNDTTTILTPKNMGFEGSSVTFPSHFTHAGYHFLFYSFEGCIGNSFARSTSALGPYEKMPHPFMLEFMPFPCTRHLSVVKALDEIEHLVFFNALISNTTYGVIVGSIEWDQDTWPRLAEV